MPPPRVIGPDHRSATVDSVVGRVTDALATVDLDGTSATVDRIVVDPAEWITTLTRAPSEDQLARTVGFSIAPYGSDHLHRDAELGHALAALLHADARAVEHLQHCGIPAIHVPLGLRAPAVTEGIPARRPLALITLGAATPRRLRVLAENAAVCDHLHTAHLLVDELTPRPPQGWSIRDAAVYVDIAETDHLDPDPYLLLDAVEANTAVVTERLGALHPPELRDHVLQAPTETLFRHARAWSENPDDARTRASSAQTLLHREHPITAMGERLATVLSGLTSSHTPPTHPGIPLPAPRLTTKSTITQTLQHERARPDAAIRAGVQDALRGIRRLERQVAVVQHGADADQTDTLHTPTQAPSPEVSILIPAYAASATLTATLDSVWHAATEPHAPRLEVIVVDDASPHNDAARTIDWATRHPELPVSVLRHRTNRGLAQTRNTGLHHATADLVLPLDADNLLRPNGLPRLLRGLHDHPQAGFAYGILQEFDERGPVGLRSMHPWDPNRLRYGNYIDALALLRRDALRTCGGYAADMPEQGYEDWSLWCSMAEADIPGVLVPEIVASYRLRAASMSEALHLSHVASLADMIARHPQVVG